MIKIYFVIALGLLIIGNASLVFADSSRLDIDSISGVYKEQFKNSTIDDNEYISENILEIVKYSQNSAYLRMHLEFFNGHMCVFRGIAEIENDSLVYRSTNKVGDQCELRAKILDGSIVFDDVGGHCRIHNCGMRGVLDSASFPLNNKRSIRYMDILLKSKQYKDSVAEYLDNSQVQDIRRDGEQ